MNGESWLWLPASIFEQVERESGTEIGNSLEFDFRRPTSAQLSRAVKADENQRSRTHSTTASCSIIQRQLRG